MPTKFDVILKKLREADVTLNSIDILTNKRMQKRTDIQASSATITPEISNYDVFVRTAQAEALVINNHSTSTPADSETMLFRLTCDATARAITYGAMYVTKSVPLPSTLIASKTTSMLFMWSSTLSQWLLMSASQE